MGKHKVLLGVNIDHVATIREARKGIEPDPVHAAVIAELAGADQITVHLREDRRHINDRDISLLRQTIKTKLNLEMAVEREIIDIAKCIRPDSVTLVPEKREEVTTEGGLDVKNNFEAIKNVIHEFESENIEVSLFIDPDSEQLNFSYKAGAKNVEFHTGQYANAKTSNQVAEELERLSRVAGEASNYGIKVKAGHGLNYQNVRAVAGIKQIEELNIGHSIVSRAVLTGLSEAVFTMKKMINE
ncbi:MAG: pyridoxine 5'-phosphate synthase [Candidatus Margulisiibacteriota bacterium]|nr:MAG: pyridoxine 5'-phosphate synthase [Candidatus Margulisbacteria bacterium GWE2_39_32]PZM83223.1 MAG: pyridoxine 5'-phosphate synthase [Candidatus Margulisiibacteriota bacterium]HCT84159.1 pyridoxine 5'-phosphate synthase [Candidatus Margulisiibacteriota bacterium]HCY37386.1 pyridoxine 5'-phosphate synthase [Candidatus Margulisiibacteriota bacterium]